MQQLNVPSPRQAATGSHLDSAAKSSKEAEPSVSLFRRLCLWFSNLLLQFPIVFELQQQFFRQPELLRGEVAQELEAMLQVDSDFIVLDYGCGSGTYTGLFKSKNYIGIDENAGMIGRARELHPKHTFIKASNLSEIKEGIAHVNQVLMIGVIHHLAEEDLVDILSRLPGENPVRILAIDTLKSTSGIGGLIQLFERGEYLRTEPEHLRLLHRIADEVSYSTVPYGKWFNLAVFRGVVKRKQP